MDEIFVANGDITLRVEVTGEGPVTNAALDAFLATLT